MTTYKFWAIGKTKDGIRFRLAGEVQLLAAEEAGPEGAILAFERAHSVVLRQFGVRADKLTIRRDRTTADPEPVCQFRIAWAGICGVTGCDVHVGIRCVSCGSAATHECPHAGTLVCGAPLCDRCEHVGNNDHRQAHIRAIIRRYWFLDDEHNFWASLAQETRELDTCIEGIKKERARLSKELAVLDARYP